jgi:hypothetical protein
VRNVVFLNPLVKLTVRGQCAPASRTRTNVFFDGPAGLSIGEDLWEKVGAWVLGAMERPRDITQPCPQS